MPSLTLNGVPASIRQDGWWLAPYESAARPVARGSGRRPLPLPLPRPRPRFALRIVVLSLLIVAGQIAATPTAPRTGADGAPVSAQGWAACAGAADLGFRSGGGAPRLEAGNPEDLTL